MQSFTSAITRPPWFVPLTPISYSCYLSCREKLNSILLKFSHFLPSHLFYLCMPSVLHALPHLHLNKHCLFLQKEIEDKPSPEVCPLISVNSDLRTIHWALGTCATYLSIVLSGALIHLPLTLEPHAWKCPTYIKNSKCAW